MIDPREAQKDFIIHSMVVAGFAAAIAALLATWTMTHGVNYALLSNFGEQAELEHHHVVRANRGKRSYIVRIEYAYRDPSGRLHSSSVPYSSYFSRSAVTGEQEHILYYPDDPKIFELASVVKTYKVDFYILVWSSLVVVLAGAFMIHRGRALKKFKETAKRY